MPKSTESVPKKERKPRAKKQPPSKEETLKLLLDSINELKQIIIDLKEDEAKISALQLKKLPELITVTLKNLTEDQEDAQADYDELLAAPNE